MSQFVEITFDCLPLRTIGRMDIPLDASPKYRQRCEKVKRAIESHGSHNTYFLYNARCTFHLTNTPDLGLLDFRFEGTAITDPTDSRTESCDLDVRLERETCDWLTQPIVAWFTESVQHAVRAEFDRFIQAGDLAAAHKRMEAVQAQSDSQSGYLGMYL